MNLPVRKRIEIPYGDIRIFVFQLTSGGTPVNLTDKDLYFGIVHRDREYTKVELNMRDEGWILDETEGKFEIVLNTVRFNMTSHRYPYEIEVELRVLSGSVLITQVTLIHYEVLVVPDVIH